MSLWFRYSVLDTTRKAGTLHAECSISNANKTASVQLREDTRSDVKSHPCVQHLLLFTEVAYQRRECLAKST